MENTYCKLWNASIFHTYLCVALFVSTHKQKLKDIFFHMPGTQKHWFIELNLILETWFILNQLCFFLSANVTTFINPAVNSNRKGKKPNSLVGISWGVNLLLKFHLIVLPCSCGVHRRAQLEGSLGWLRAQSFCAAAAHSVLGAGLCQDG